MNFQEKLDSYRRDPSWLSTVSNPLARIAKQIKKRQLTEQPWLIDATAGLASDGFLLANLGFKVLLLEHNIILATKLYQALAVGARELGRVGQNLAVSECELSKLCQRLSLQIVDARSYMQLLAKSIVLPSASWRAEDLVAIYLDPMFSNNIIEVTAKPNKAMQLIQELTSRSNFTEQAVPEQASNANLPEKATSEQAISLFQAAYQLSKQKQLYPNLQYIIIKRPRKGPRLDENLRVPTYQIKSKKLRFDVYLIP